MDSVDIFLYNRNNPEKLANCLDRLLAIGRDFNLTVIDDCSEAPVDDLVKPYAEKYGGRIKLQKNPEYAGYFQTADQIAGGYGNAEAYRILNTAIDGDYIDEDYLGFPQEEAGLAAGGILSAFEFAEAEKEPNLPAEASPVKKISLDDLFMNSIVISIDDGQYGMFDKIFSKLSPIKPLKIKGTTDQDTSIKNIAISHINAVKKAKELDWSFVCIFEDDAYPAADAVQKLPEYLDNIPEDAQLVMLGWLSFNKNDGDQLFESKFNPITSYIYGAHSYILFKESYDKYIKEQEGKLYYNGSSADGTIFNFCSPSYIVQKPMFIQFSPKTSTHGHVGYYWWGNNERPPDGFVSVEELLREDGE